MKKSRLEAFSDGLFAVAMTIMVLAMDAPSDVTFKSAVPVLPVLLSYVLSFIYIAIFWINHHQLVAATRKINSKVLWANLFFLFWITLIPFATSWVDENHISPLPVATYGVVLLMCAASYRLLERVLFKSHDANALIVQILRDGWREKLSMVLYVLAIGLAYVHPFISLGIYVAVACLWFIPNRQLEKVLSEKDVCDID
jgi:uncharacterized membrane protein